MNEAEKREIKDYANYAKFLYKSSNSEFRRFYKI